MTDSPSPSDTPALTEGGGHAIPPISDRLHEIAESPNSELDKIRIMLRAAEAHDARVASLLARAEAAEKRVEKLEHSDKEWGRLHQAVIMERAEALIALEAAEKERDDLQQNVWALESKVSALSAHESCACSWDRAGDVCLHHSPKLVAAQARIDALTGEVARLRDGLRSICEIAPGSQEWVDGRVSLAEESAIARQAVSIARAVLSPVKQEPNNG